VLAARWKRSWLIGCSLVAMLVVAVGAFGENGPTYGSIAELPEPDLVIEDRLGDVESQNAGVDIARVEVFTTAESLAFAITVSGSLPSSLRSWGVFCVFLALDSKPVLISSHWRLCDLIRAGFEHGVGFVYGEVGFLHVRHQAHGCSAMKAGQIEYWIEDNVAYFETTWENLGGKPETSVPIFVYVGEDPYRHTIDKAPNSGYGLIPDRVDGARQTTPRPTACGIARETFEDGDPSWWYDPGWSVVQEGDGNHALYGNGLWQWAGPHTGTVDWTDFTVRFRMKLISGGLHANVRMFDSGDGYTRYMVGFREDHMWLGREYPSGTYTLLSDAHGLYLTDGAWHDVEIVLSGAQIETTIDGVPVMSHTDKGAVLPYGGVAFETAESPPGSGSGSYVYIDDVEVVCGGN